MACGAEDPEELWNSACDSPMTRGFAFAPDAWVPGTPRLSMSLPWFIRAPSPEMPPALAPEPPPFAPLPPPPFLTFHISAAAFPISVAWVVTVLRFSLAMRPASVAAVSVPERVDRPQIVTLGPGSEVRLSEQHRWAEPLKLAIGRLVADRLSQALGATLIAANYSRLLIDLNRSPHHPGSSAGHSISGQ